LIKKCPFVACCISRFSEPLGNKAKGKLIEMFRKVLISTPLHCVQYAKVMLKKHLAKEFEG